MRSLHFAALVLLCMPISFCFFLTIRLSLFLSHSSNLPVHLLACVFLNLASVHLFFYRLSVFQQFLNLKYFVNVRFAETKSAYKSDENTHNAEKTHTHFASFHMASMCFFLFVLLFVYFFTKIESEERDREKAQKDRDFLFCAILFCRL